MKNFALIIIFTFVSNLLFSQGTNKIYNPSADAEKELNKAIIKAKQENKFVLAQVGGNWCGWCLMINKFLTTDKQLDSLMKANFVYLHINYSKENKNLKLLEKLEYPQRFGFPVIVIFDSNGKRLHTQNTGYLEEGKAYNKNKIMEFLEKWSPEALNPENYKDK